MVAAGAVVTRDVPPYAIVKGNPARIACYSNAVSHKPDGPKINANSSSVKGVALLSLKTVSDMRGDLLAVETQKDIPFKVARVFTIMNVPSHHIRGEHAHKKCHQLLVCLQGSVKILTDNGISRKEWVLNRPELGLHIEPYVWAAQFNYSQNAVLSVYASRPYEANDYIRDYEDFLSFIKKNKK